MRIIDGDYLYNVINNRERWHYVPKKLLKEMIAKVPEIDVDTDCFTINDLWIDCYNSLPDKNDYYLITVLTGSNKQLTTVHEAYFRDGKWEYNQANQNDVVAWMPYPAPYDG